MVIFNASDPNTAKKINDIIKNTKHIFILVYMVGCGPCNATRPEWKKMCQSLENKYSLNDDVAILDLDSKFMNEVEGLGDINGFPTMKYMSDNGNVVEAYEDSSIPNKERSSNSFIEWIESKVSKKNGGGVDYSSPMNVNELSELLSYKQLNSTKTINSMSESNKIKTKRIRTKRIRTKRMKAKKTQKRKNKKQNRRKSSKSR